MSSSFFKQEFTFDRIARMLVLALLVALIIWAVQAIWSIILPFLLAGIFAYVVMPSKPVEQEAQIRLMEKLQNHHGKDSVLVLRPCDVEETTVAWRMAVENTHTPTALILSRQNINDLPAPEGKTRAEAAEQATRGGYIVLKDEAPEVILIANGSEVSTLVEGADLLHKDGIRLQIVAVPSEGLFRQQSKEYQAEVLPAGVKRFGLTAGLPVNLLGLVGDNGAIWGLNSFGFSAPYKVLDEKLGFTAQNVYTQVKQLLAK